MPRCRGARNTGLQLCRGQGPRGSPAGDRGHALGSKHRVRPARCRPCREVRRTPAARQSSGCNQHRHRVSRSPL